MAVVVAAPMAVVVAADAGDGSNASGPSAGQSGSGARPASKRHREPDDGAPALPATLVLSNTGRRIRLTLAAQTQLHDETDEMQEDRDTVEETPWTLANVSAQRAMRGSTQRDAERAQSGRPKRSAGRPARVADGAEVSSVMVQKSRPMMSWVSRCSQELRIGASADCHRQTREAAE